VCVAAGRGDDANFALICRKHSASGVPVVGHCQLSLDRPAVSKVFGILANDSLLAASNAIDSRMDSALRVQILRKRCGETAGSCDPAAVGGGYKRAGKWGV
jgi:hypothetical protein